MPRFKRVRIGERFRFKCIRCDFCCGTGPNIALTVFDVIRIARFLRISWREALQRYTKVIIADLFPFIALRDKGDGDCVFLERKPNGETLCVIYPARPMRCRLYPIIVEALSEEGLYLDLECPGVGQGGEVEAPRRLVAQYIWERREHYRRLYKYIVEEGMEPMRALEKVFEETWREAEEGAKWADLDYLESLGQV